MSTFRGGSTSQSGGPSGSQQSSSQVGQHSPAIYNHIAHTQQQQQHSHPQQQQQIAQHSPAVQNDSIVGKAIQTMYTPADQSISSFSSNPSTPVNSPPPLTSHSNNNPNVQQQQQTAHSLHPSANSQASTWQQLTPVINNGANSSQHQQQQQQLGLQNGVYTPDLVPRGLHMVSDLPVSFCSNPLLRCSISVFVYVVLCRYGEKKNNYNTKYGRPDIRLDMNNFPIMLTSKSKPKKNKFSFYL